MIYNKTCSNCPHSEYDSKYQDIWCYLVGEWIGTSELYCRYAEYDSDRHVVWCCLIGRWVDID